MLVEVSEQSVPRVVAHRKAQAFAVNIADGQLVRLFIANRLDEVFQSPQVTVGTMNLSCIIDTDAAFADQEWQDLLQFTPLQRGLAAAANQLQRLYDKFRLANAAWPQLDVTGEFPAAYFGGDHLLHFPNGFEDAEVQVAAVHEWSNELVVQLIGNLGWRHRTDDTRFDIGVTLPVPAVLQQIGFQRGKTDDGRPALPEGSQARINPEYKPIDRRIVNQCDNLPAQSPEVFFRTELPFAVRLAVLRVTKNQVDV